MCNNKPSQTSNIQEILSGHICPYCGRQTELIDSAEVYNGTSYGLMYICRPCDAYVGCYKNTSKSLGRLANARLRALKHAAHSVFDLIWKNGFIERFDAYTWLSQQLGTERELTHIGMYDEEQCKQVIEVSRKFLLEKDEAYFSPIINDLHLEQLLQGDQDDSKN